MIYGFVTQSGHLFPAMSLPQPGIIAGDTVVPAGHYYGFYWSMFIGLGLGLIFSLIGSATGCSYRKAS